MSTDEPDPDDPRDGITEEARSYRRRRLAARSSPATEPGREATAWIVVGAEVEDLPPGAIVAACTADGTVHEAVQPLAVDLLDGAMAQKLGTGRQRFRVLWPLTSSSPSGTATADPERVADWNVVTGAEAQMLAIGSSIVDERDLQLGLQPPARYRVEGSGGHHPDSWSDGVVPQLARSYRVLYFAPDLTSTSGLTVGDTDTAGGA